MPSKREDTNHELVEALSAEQPPRVRGVSRLAVLRWLDDAWSPEKSEEHLELEAFLRSADWSFVSEHEVGDPVLGVFRIYECQANQPDTPGPPHRGIK